MSPLNYKFIYPTAPWTFTLGWLINILNLRCSKPNSRSSINPKPVPILGFIILVNGDSILPIAQALLILEHNKHIIATGSRCFLCLEFSSTVYISYSLPHFIKFSTLSRDDFPDQNTRTSTPSASFLQNIYYYFKKCVFICFLKKSISAH